MSITSAQINKCGKHRSTMFNEAALPVSFFSLPNPASPHLLRCGLEECRQLRWLVVSKNHAVRALAGFCFLGLLLGNRGAEIGQAFERVIPERSAQAEQARGRQDHEESRPSAK
jgi:hypothetical protein